MAITSRLTSAGDYQVANEFDEYTYPNAMYGAQFNGSNQYLTGGTGNAALYLDGDFTIEFWINGNGGGFYRYMFSKYAGYTAGNNISIAYRNGNSTNISIFRGSAGGSGVIFNGGPGVTDGVWYHVAVVRSTASSLYKVFINGIGYNWLLNDTGVWDYTSFTVMGNPVDGGASLAQTATGGYLSNLRVVKGRAIYTANFTPPTSPLTAVPGTQLLTCQNPTIVDNSTNAYTITNNNTATTTNTNIPISFYYGIFNGSTQYLQTTTTALTGAYTIEFWVFNQSFGGADGKGYVFNGTTSSNANRVQIGIGSTGQFYYYHENASAGTFTINAGATLFSLNTWYHVAVVSDGTTLKLYINGTSVSSGTITNTPSPGTSFYIGFLRNSGALQYFNGYMSNFRYTRTVVYTANFTPPTRQLSAIPGTSLLTLQSPTITDRSGNALSITNNGTVTVTSPIWLNTPKREFSDGTIQMFNDIDEYTLPNIVYATQFNGTSQYLIVPSNAAFAFPGDFTFEGWFYKLTAWTNTMDLVQGNGTSGISFYSAASTLRSGPNNISSYSLGSSTGIPINAWVHIAFVRKSNSARIYVNGVPLAAAVSDTNSYAQTALYIGGGVDGYFDGYMSNVRIIKGTAIYDPALSSFTPPVGPLTAITNTQLLTCQNPTIIDNSTNALTITNTGAATTTNVPSTFYSGLFNGSSQYLLASGSQSTGITSDNFTVECWFNLSSLTYNPAPNPGLYIAVLYSAAGTGALNTLTSNIIWFYIAGSLNSPNAIQFGPGGTAPTGPTVTGSGLTIPLNTWHHVAVSRNGTNMAMWFNGVRVASITNASGNYAAGTSAIGVNTGSASNYNGWFTGYISNFRIVKGSTAYDPTSTSITVPTSPLTAVTNTYLLTLQSPTIIDNSTNAFTITNVNTVTVQPPASFVKTKSKLFGNGSLQVANSFDEYTAAVAVDYLVVAGGGGGGTLYAGGGGGAGGMRTGTLKLAKGSAYTVTVGAGGATGSNGSISVLSSITSTGGGRGGNYYAWDSSDSGQNGGSGGGGSGNYYSAPGGGSNVIGQGNIGGNSTTFSNGIYKGAGGGGAGTAGGASGSTSAGNGGAGLDSTITGSSVTYAGGGGGAVLNETQGSTGGTAGAGGGGTGGRTNGTQTATSGTANLGGGGGGGGTSPVGSGGSGVVIIRFLDSLPNPTSTTGTPTITTTGGYKIYQWTSSGSITF